MSRKSFASVVLPERVIDVRERMISELESLWAALAKNVIK
jgi:hypothetical protein